MVFPPPPRSGFARCRRRAARQVTMRRARLASENVLSRGESPARRIGAIVSFLFLVSLGTVATLVRVPAGGHEADARIDIAALPTGMAR